LNQLDREQKRVQLLLEELRTVKATNARRIAELKEELSTVRKVLVTYVRQVDSLTAVNTKLEAENRKVQQRYEAATEEVKTLSEERERLVEKVTIASQLEATSIAVDLQNDRGRKTKSVRKLAIIKVDYTIAKNNTAEVGNKTIYMRITTPDDMVLQKQASDVFQFEDSKIAFSARKSFEYTGEEFSDAIYYTVTETLWEGDYRVDLFADGHLIGQQYFNLSK
jgi:phenylalanyl-tRNA synthetase alpha subunit